MHGRGARAYIRAHLALNVTPDNRIRVDVSRKLLNARPESRDLQRRRNRPVAPARNIPIIAAIKEFERL